MLDIRRVLRDILITRGLILAQPSLFCRITMSLLIIEENIIGLYALNQWFKVIKGSVDIGPYEVCAIRETRRSLIFSMGVFCPEIDSQSCTSGSAYMGNDGDYVVRETTRDTGIAFMEAGSGDRISFSLSEVKAFIEDERDPEDETAE